MSDQRFLEEAWRELDAIDVKTGVMPPAAPPCADHEPETIDISVFGDFERRHLCARCGFQWRGAHPLQP